MKISTLSIGTELVTGEVPDDNAACIGERLHAEGMTIQRHLAVGDVEPDIMESLLYLAERSDVVVVTGGLGPTADDITARAAARVTGRRLVLNEEALSHVKGIAEKRGAVPPLTDKQALVPTKSTIIPNPIGTACGFHLTHQGHYLFFLPGVPAEMARMLDETVIPFIRQRYRQKRVVQKKVLRVFGPAEAEVGLLLKELNLPEGVSLSIGTSFPELLVKLRGEGEDGGRTGKMLSTAAEQVREKLKDALYGEGEETIDFTVASLFRSRGVSVAVAESCSGGLLAKRLTDVPGSSGYFLEGIVTYADAAKTRELEVSPQLLADKGAVSAEVATAMAKGMRKRAGSDLALAVTGIAGPDGGTPAKPVGTVFISLASRAGCHTKRYHFSGNRNEIRTITVFTALDWLRRQLLII